LVPFFSGEPAFRRRVFVVNGGQYIMEAGNRKRNAGKEGQKGKEGKKSHTCDFLEPIKSRVS